MDGPQLEEFITQLRDRRATVTKRLASARRSHASTDSEALRKKLDGKILKLSKVSENIDKLFTRAEVLIAEIITLRLAYGERPEEIGL